MVIAEIFIKWPAFRPIMRALTNILGKLIVGNALALSINCGSESNIPPHIEIIDRRPQLDYIDVKVFGNYRDLFFLRKNGDCALQLYSTRDSSSFIDYGCDGRVDEMLQNGAVTFRSPGTEDQFRTADDLYHNGLSQIEEETGMGLNEVVGEGD